ncbi:MAG: F0F1 ATP synthase subunit A [Erysipelotrichales bacterium]|nr:F0F1 ATP synthase subunit A [Erysipelotrichales bacterium]
MDKIWDYIVNKMPGELMVSLLIMFFIAIVAIILGHAIKKADPTKPPKGLAFIADWLVEFSLNCIDNNLGDAYDFAAPYFIFLITFIPLAFMSGLLGFATPMTYFTIPLCLAFVSWLGIQLSAIVFQKLDYLKGFTSPLPTWIPVFVPINILSKMSPLLSLSIRMFGNALAGSILMWLVYWGTGELSSLILNNFNIFGVVITPILHAYFDIFSTFIQTLIFVLLTMQLISIEIPAPVHKKEKNKKKEEKQTC